ncbi:MAG: hypothetical protein AAF483_20255 [Planctomycetota bacterium]
MSSIGASMTVPDNQCMKETSLSLLNRLRGSTEPESWNRLVELYTPLIRVWLRKYEVQANDADDLIQEVLLAYRAAR